MARKLTDADIEAAAREALKSSLGAPDSDIGAARLRNLEFYNAEAMGELAPPEIADRSGFRGDRRCRHHRRNAAADHADVRVLGRCGGVRGQANLGRRKRSSSQPPTSTICSYVRNDGIGVIHDWFKDALLQKVGWVKVWARGTEPTTPGRSTRASRRNSWPCLCRTGWQPDGMPEVDDNGLLNFTVRKNHAPRQSAFARWPRCACALTRNAR